MAGRQRKIAIALDRDGVASGRHFGKREAAAFIGGLKAGAGFRIGRLQHHLRATQRLARCSAQDGSLDDAWRLRLRRLRGRRWRYRRRSCRRVLGQNGNQAGESQQAKLQYARPEVHSFIMTQAAAIALEWRKEDG